MKELNLTSINNKKLLVSFPINKIEDIYLNECAFALSNQEYPIDVLILANGLEDSDIEKVKSIFDKPEITMRKKDEKTGTLVDEKICSDKKINYTIEKTEKTKYSEYFNELFNYAIINNYEWISPIEYYDVVDYKWYHNFDKFEQEKQDVGIFLPITREINNGIFTNFFNEACWAEGFAEVAGYFDLQLLLRFNCSNLIGGVYKIELLKEYSEKDENDYYKPIKESIKLSFSHEFFLRMIYNDIKVFTIQRFGYERRGKGQYDNYNLMSTKLPQNLVSISEENNGMNEQEVKFWIDLPKKEYFFDNDRKEEFKKE